VKVKLHAVDIADRRRLGHQRLLLPHDTLSLCACLRHNSSFQLIILVYLAVNLCFL
jgi:hypothetical protein